MSSLGKSQSVPVLLPVRKRDPKNWHPEVVQALNSRFSRPRCVLNVDRNWFSTKLSDFREQVVYRTVEISNDDVRKKVHACLSSDFTIKSDAVVELRQIEIDKWKEINKKVALRQEARAKHDWERTDDIQEKLLAEGILVLDSGYELITDAELRQFLGVGMDAIITFDDVFYGREGHERKLPFTVKFRTYRLGGGMKSTPRTRGENFQVPIVGRQGVVRDPKFEAWRLHEEAVVQKMLNESVLIQRQGEFEGDVIHVERMTIQEAKLRCSTMPTCKAFTFKDLDPSESFSPNPRRSQTSESIRRSVTSMHSTSGHSSASSDARVDVYFKNRCGKRIHNDGGSSGTKYTTFVRAPALAQRKGEFEGEVLLVESMTLEEAKARCSTMSLCKCFTFAGSPRSLKEDEQIEVSFMTRCGNRKRDDGTKYTTFVRDSGSAYSEPDFKRIRTVLNRRRTPAQMIWFLRALAKRLHDDVGRRAKEMRGGSAKVKSFIEKTFDPKRKKMSEKEVVDSAFTLTRTEFLQMMISSGDVGMTRREGDDTFKAFDISGNGLVCILELTGVIEKLMLEVEGKFDAQAVCDIDQGAKRTYVLATPGETYHRGTKAKFSAVNFEKFEITRRERARSASGGSR